MKSKQKIKGFRRRNLMIPFGVFLILFIIIPILLIVYYAFSDESGRLSAGAFLDFFQNPTKVSILGVSIFVGIQTTLLCLIIGFPLSYFLANSKYNKNRILIVLFILPMWINFVLRTGATRDLLTWFGQIIGMKNGFTGTLPYLSTLIGMVYNFLPFAILPLYTTMLKLDKFQMEACSDLGASPTQVFFKSVIPQSIPGISSAFTMVFMPTMSSYVISDTLSEGKVTLFGSSIYISFSNSQWNTGSFMALVMLFFVAITLLITGRGEKTNVRGGNLW